MNSEKLLFTVGEAAERLNLGRTLLYGLVLRGEIASVTVGRCRRVPAAALDAFVAERLAVQMQRTSAQHGREVADAR